MTDERPAAERDDQTEPSDPTDPTDATTDGPTTDETTTPMSDTADGTTEPRRTDDSTDDASGPDDAGIGRLSTDRLRGILDRVGLAALVLLALVAGWSFYSQSGTAIRTWLDPAYQPIALAVFNLAVLLVALAGVGHQLARIRSHE
ncbi:hypothetical protein U4E84_14985 [Halorubrum sp. AD140]|uniref:hypothetical protein n=1 Tax=Halorubrum sp. AD140 TaxID=3050073 RepID=UPI002ACCC14B|nr:hypothetical protein [Halorubrum sp. AD140]MDZ5812651.1 hypothetical protein [Halorubrum sp. AD140]